MTTAWMFWSASAGLPLALAAMALERLRPGGRRWIWIAAAGGTALLPTLRSLVEPVWGAGAPTVAFVSLPSLAVPGGPSSSLAGMDLALRFGWAGLSAGLAALALANWMRLRGRRSRWESGALQGRAVLWSRTAGPGVVGVVKPRIVLPIWVQGAGAARQRLILAHEEEHVKAKDGRLRLLFDLLVVAFPWNPALWIQRRRFDLAVEMDCDDRVLRRWPDRRGLYGDLLVRVGAGGRLVGLAAAFSSGRRSQVERRLIAISRKATPPRLAQAALLAFGAAFAVAVAVTMPGVFDRGRSLEEGTPTVEKDPAVDRSAEPSFTPFTEAPRLTNADEAVQALQREYPPLLRDAGVGGTVIVWFRVNETGGVGDARVARGSGHQGLDDAALRAASSFEFAPARLGDDPVVVWTQFPVTFAVSPE